MRSRFSVSSLTVDCFRPKFRLRPVRYGPHQAADGVAAGPHWNGHRVKWPRFQ
jgi:hypothetical protein